MEKAETTSNDCKFPLQMIVRLILTI